MKEVYQPSILRIFVFIMLINCPFMSENTLFQLSCSVNAICTMLSFVDTILPLTVTSYVVFVAESCILKMPVSIAPFLIVAFGILITPFVEYLLCRCSTLLILRWLLVLNTIATADFDGRFRALSDVQDFPTKRDI